MPVPSVVIGAPVAPPPDSKSPAMSSTSNGGGQPHRGGGFLGNEDLEAWATDMSHVYGVTQRDVLRCHATFQKTDRDNSGVVDMTELRELLAAVSGTEMSDNEYLRVMGRFDQDQSGTLDFDEFMNAYSHTPLQRALQLEQQIDAMGKDTRADMENKRMAPEDRIVKVGVNLPVVRSYLLKELEEASACLALPWAAVMFLSFALSVLLHERTEELHAIDHAITSDISENANFAFVGEVPFENGRMGHKSMFDVNSFADFWSWFAMGIVPLFFTGGGWDVNEVRTNAGTHCGNFTEGLLDFGWSPSSLRWQADSVAGGLCDTIEQASEMPPGPRPFFQGTPTYLYYNAVVGGIRMRQERTVPVTCPEVSESVKGAIFAGDCVWDPGYWLMPELRNALQMDTSLVNLPGGEDVYLKSGMSARDVRLELQRLENEVWLHPETAKVEILFPTYNPHLGVITATYMFFFINRGGHIHKIIEPVSLWLNPYHSPLCYVIDFIWVMLVLKMFLEESWHLCQHFIYLGFVKGLKSYLNPNNFVDWIGVGFSVIIVYQFAIYLSDCEHMIELLEDARVDVLGSWQEHASSVEFFELLTKLVQRNNERRQFLALYPCVVLTRFFKAFSAQPRLSLVTMTISRAATDVVHFGVVFGTVFVVFSFSAMILFGQELDEFANAARSLNTAFRILLGDFDWDRMSSVGRLQAGIWFWIFMWLVNLVMLNMLLAIIMDVYTEVKGNIGSEAETLFSQTYEILRRYRDRKAGLRVSLDHVLSQLSPKGKFSAQLDAEDRNPEMITIDGLIAKVPGLGEKQASRILLASQGMLDSDNMKAQSISEAMMDIQRIDDRLTNLHVSVERLIHMSEMSTALLVSTAERGRGGDPGAKAPPRTKEPQIDTVEIVAPELLPKMSEQLERILEKHTDHLLRQHKERCDRLEDHLVSVEAKVARLPTSQRPGDFGTLSGFALGSAKVGSSSGFGRFCAEPQRSRYPD